MKAMRRLNINFSNTLENVDKTEIGLKLPMICLSPPLYIGVTLAILRLSGKTPELIGLLKILASGFAKEYLALLITKEFNESQPGELPQGSLFKTSVISSCKIGLRKRE